MEARIHFFLVPLGVSVGTERVLNFCGDEDSTSDLSNIISFTPCDIELLRLV
jgi:hypothetical protein